MGHVPGIKKEKESRAVSVIKEDYANDRERERKQQQRGKKKEESLKSESSGGRPRG